MKKIVLSGINLFEGGPLSIYYDLLDSICLNNFDKSNNIVAFVHKKELFEKYKTSNIMFLELPLSRKNYIYRLYYEYRYFKKWSKNRSVDLWISLHDITPNVYAKSRVVYCHNPSIFYKFSFLDFKYSKKNILFSLLYKNLYRINIKKNDYVIVQQHWIKKKFQKYFSLKNVIVAKPIIKIDFLYKSIEKKNDCYYFIFPAFPRVFKNMEVICEACQYLEKSGLNNFKVILTLNGTENHYSKYLYKKYKHVKTVEWLGILKREDVFSLYDKVNCLIFPSKLETWGLPISEFKETGKKMLLSDLPYAHETIGNYDKVSFFNPNSYKELSNLMVSCMKDEKLQGNIECAEKEIIGWKSTLDYILSKGGDE